MDKTVATAGLAPLPHAGGKRVAAVKLVQAAVGAGEPGDPAEVRRLSGLGDLHELARFSEPLARATAARPVGLPAQSLEDLARAGGALADRDLVLGCLGLVIGAGAGAGAAQPDLAAVCNLDALPRYTGPPIPGRLGENARRLAPPGFLEIAGAGLAPARADWRYTHDPQHP